MCLDREEAEGLLETWGLWMYRNHDRVFPLGYSSDGKMSADRLASPLGVGGSSGSIDMPDIVVRVEMELSRISNKYSEIARFMFVGPKMTLLERKSYAKKKYIKKFGVTVRQYNDINKTFWDKACSALDTPVDHPYFRPVYGWILILGV